MRLLLSVLLVQCVQGIAGIQCGAEDQRLFVDVEITAVHAVLSGRKSRISGTEIGIASFQSRRCHEFGIIISVEG